MSITQERADQIKQECRDELIEIFGDIENIDFVTAIIIAEYCKKRTTFHDMVKEPIEHNYWNSMASAYGEAIKAAISALDKLKK